ncbi:MAG: PQQ-like beta-propeller repeat protein [Chloroflexi bacterium]|nr:PQQ-like beta-propeller repeat protein [Chloroflexota bacterium]
MKKSHVFLTLGIAGALVVALQTPPVSSAPGHLLGTPTPTLHPYSPLFLPLVINQNNSPVATATPLRTPTQTTTAPSPTATRTSAAPTPTTVPGLPANSEWTQDAHDAQRTGYSPVEPAEPWTFLWSWNGADANGGTGNHFYNAPREARTVTGGNNVYVPAGTQGLYALAKTNGAQAWRVTTTAFNGTPAFDASTNSVFAGGADGKLYKINATTGAVIATYTADAPLNRAVLLTSSHAYAISDSGQLHKVSIANLAKAWSYAAGSNASTGLAYSASRDVIVFGTDDLYVHAVNNSNGVVKWRVKPTPNTAGFPNEYRYYFPVVADQHGVVFLRMRLEHNAGLWGYPSTGNIWPNTNAAARTFLQDNPSKKNLFALNLDNGAEKFIPAVGYTGTEDLYNGSAYLTTGPVPVVKTFTDGTEVAYIQFRNGQGAPPDGRWDSNMGEMVLDNTTIAGLVAGDLRFVKMNRWNGQGGSAYTFVTDEQNLITLAGNSLFHAHWGASESVKITNRASTLGLSYLNPITAVNHPTIIRRQTSCGNFNPTTHATTCGLTLFNDGRYWDGPGWWTYWNVLDPPTIAAGTYSDGVRPRYTYVSGNLMIVEGNGGDLMIFRHSGP